MMGYGYGGMGLLGGLIGLIVSIAVLVGIVLLIVWAVRSLSGGASHWNQPSGSQSPADILKVRYARGEITREQYQQMLKDLG